MFYYKKILQTFNIKIMKFKSKKLNSLYSAVSILIPFLMSMFCTFSLGSLALVMALTQDTRPAWHITTIMVGMAIGSMTTGMAISGLIAAYSIDRVSKKPVAVIGGLLTGFSFILLANSWNWEVFFIAVVLTGVGNGIVAPVIFALISDATPPEKRATNYGLFFLFGLAGTIYVIIFFLPTMMIDKNWEGAYSLFGLYIVLLALLVIFTKLPGRGQKDLNLQDLIEVDGIHYEYSIRLKDLKNILKRKSNKYLILNFADAIPVGINTFIIFWLVKEHHLEYSAALGIFIIIVFLGFLMPVFWGIYTDSKLKSSEDERLKIKICILLLSIASPLTLIAVFIPWDASGISDTWSLFTLPGFVAAFILLIGIYIFFPGIKPIWQSTITEVNLPEHRTTSYQIAMFVDQIGTAIGAFVAGYLIFFYGYAAAFIFGAIMGLINILTWIAAYKHYHEDKLEVERILKERIDKMKSKIVISEQLTRTTKRKRRGGLSVMLWRQLEPLNSIEVFKEQFKNVKKTILLNATDQKWAAILKIDHGSLDVESVDNSLNLEKLFIVKSWDAMFKTTSKIFLEVVTGKISKWGMIWKVLTGKIEIKNAKDLRILQTLNEILQKEAEKTKQTENN